MIKKGAVSTELLNVISLLRGLSRRTGAKLWRDIADQLGKPKSRRVSVNVSRINRCTSDGDVVVVPGKVLASGQLDHPVKVIAFRFSKQAEKKIVQAGGKCLSMIDVVKEPPKGSRIKIVK